MSDSPWTVEAEISAPGVKVQIRNGYWSAADPVDRLESEYALSLLLTSPNEYGTGRSFTGKPAQLGAMNFVPIEMPLQFRGKIPGNRRQVRCVFDRSRLEALIGNDIDWYHRRLEACFDVRDDRLDRAIRRLADEALAPGLGTEALIEGLGLTMMADLTRYLQRPPPSDAPAIGGLAAWQIKRLADYIIANAASPTISELAQLCGLSGSHLRHAFKVTTGQTVHRYVEQIRLSKARSLLADTDLPLKEIAFRLGFPSQSGFSIAFRRAAGETPGAFRRKYFHVRESSPNG